MDAHSLHILEYRKVIERLTAHTSSALGEEYAAQLQPLPYPETVTRRLQETREARGLRDSDSSMPLGGIRDIRETAERARIGTKLIPHDLLDIMHTVAAARRMRMFLLNRQDKCPLLAESVSTPNARKLTSIATGSSPTTSRCVRKSGFDGGLTVR